MLSNIRYILVRLLSKKPPAIKNSRIDKTASIGNGAQIVNCSIGRYTYAHNCGIVNAHVGAFTSIAGRCVIGGGRHPTNWVSSSPVFYAGHNVLHKNFSDTPFEEYRDTEIGNDVWIGSGCLIKGGVHIGNGAIVGMGSVVTHDIPPYEIWAGNPARFIRKRFPDEISEALQKSQWWDLLDEDLNRLGRYFDDPVKLLSKLEEM